MSYFHLGADADRDSILRINGSPIARVAPGEKFRVSSGDRVTIVPSPYFNVVVDQRAGKVAASMAGRAARLGWESGQLAALRARQASKLSRLIRWWKSL